MIPMEFDFRILSTLPLPTEERIKDVVRLLKGLAIRRVVPYFKSERGTDPLRLARVGEQLSIQRLEDEQNLIRCLCLVNRGDAAWVIQIHERIFDYLAFVMPSDPQSRLGEGTSEERKMLAFIEFFLRHEMEHLLYSERKEREVVLSDIRFAMERRESDPTFYRALRQFLADEMNGIRGQSYLELFDTAERAESCEALTSQVLNVFATALGEVPDALLEEALPALDGELKTRILGECYRRSRDNTISLLQRTSGLHKFLHLFALIIGRNEKEGAELFQAFRDRWGLVVLFQELEVPETHADEKTPDQLLQLFKTHLNRFLDRERQSPLPHRAPLATTPEFRPMPRAEKSLTDRIEDARNDPGFPRQVLAVIDKNKLNAVGHSGSKYSELIETLLAIPWGKIQKIRVSPEDFEAGLNRTHYGLQRPKELLCDFFTNLIWRYRDFSEARAASWRQTGSAFLFVGPPGVGKTSLAISIAQNLGIPYHKISLGGMRDEADVRGHGFTYEGSKPGAIVQGLIKMGVMNGMFILDEADKTEKFAIATLLEILDPEQNHLFHDKFTETTVDIDLSNCHFVLTANTLETVPQVVVNRCEVVWLDRYSVEEKVAIAQQYLIQRLRHTYQIDAGQIYFDPATEADLLRYLIRTYTYEAGVRELSRIVRTLFLRIQRKEILTGGPGPVRITREKIKQYLKEPTRPRQINAEDRVGEMLALGVDVERGVGSIIPIQATRINLGPSPAAGRRSYLSILHATGNIEKVMDESRKVATTGIFHCAEELGINLEHMEEPVHLHFMGGSTRKDGPSAGAAIALALASLLSHRRIRRDVAMTGEIDTKGRITAVGGLAVKLETAYGAGCRTVLIPRENLTGEEGIERFPDALREELQILSYDDWCGRHAPFDYTRHSLQVVAVDHIVQAAQVAFIDDAPLKSLEETFVSYARELTAKFQADRMQPAQCLQVVQVKTPEEIDPEFFQPPFLEACDVLTLLAPPAMREAIQARLPEAHQQLSIRDFDPYRQNLSDVVVEILASCSSDSACPTRLSLVAPFYFLKRDGISAEAFPPGPSFEGVKLFANNYSVQEVKIKGCKRVLNRVYCLLTHLSYSELDACPFLDTKDGIYVADLAFIPEPYRLDVKRAEELLNRSLKRWLAEIRSKP